MKKGIIVASFGTSFPEVRKKAIETIENSIAEKYKSHEVRRAFTSNMIISKLKKRDGIHIQKPLEALHAMVQEGYTEIHVQPLHVIPGFEYEKVLKAVKHMNHNKHVQVTIGKPLLSQEHHYDELVKIIGQVTPSIENHAYVWMGHGTEHHANACYAMLQAKLNDERSDVFIANVEGYPELDHILKKLVSFESITLIPLMIVAGDHAMNDMAGDEDSFKTTLEGLGKEVTCRVQGLGELESIEQAFIRRIEETYN